MKLFKRTAVALLVGAGVVTLSACSKVPPAGWEPRTVIGQGGTTVAGRRMTEAQAEQLLADSISRTTQALGLAYMGLSAKHGVQTAGEPDPTTPVVVTSGGPATAAPIAGAPAPAADGAAAPVADGAAAPAEAAPAPVLPKLRGSEALANELLEQAWVLLDDVRGATEPLFGNSVLADRGEPRLDDLRDLMSAVEQTVKAGSNLEPKTKSILTLIAAKAAAEAAPTGDAAAPAAPAGPASAAPAAPSPVAGGPSTAPAAPAAPAVTAPVPGAPAVPAPVAGAPAPAAPSPVAGAPAAPSAPAPAPSAPAAPQRVPGGPATPAPVAG